MIITPEELAKQLKVDELADPVVEKICKSLTEKLCKGFTPQKLSDEAVVEITTSISTDTAMPELDALKNEIKRRIILSCHESHWNIINSQLSMSSIPKNKILTQITFKGGFTPAKDALQTP